MNTPDYDMYKELAELKLQNTLLSQRPDMMTRMAMHCDGRRADLCTQLREFDLVIAMNNQVIRKPKNET